VNIIVKVNKIHSKISTFKQGLEWLGEKKQTQIFICVHNFIITGKETKRTTETEEEK